MAKHQTFTLKFVTPEKVMFEDEVTSVTADTIEGPITVYARHVQLITNLKPGEIVIHKEGQDDKPVVVSGGILEVAQNKMVVMADTAEHVHDLDIKRAEEAVAYAEKLLDEKKHDVREYETLQEMLDKNKARVGAFRKWRG